MAQAVRHDEALLLQKDASGQKMPGAYVPADKLHYSHGWEINEICAVLIGSFDPRVWGEYSTQKLTKALNYEVSFDMMLKDCNIDEVDLTLTLPDGSMITHREHLNPSTERIQLKVGDFCNRFESGNVKFELKGAICRTLQKGLVIYGVRINPLLKADA